MASYTKNRAWSMTYEQGLLVLTAGSDKLFAVEDVTETVADELLGQWRHGRFEPGKLSSGGQDIFEQLLTAEIIINALEERPHYKVALQFVGDPNVKLRTQLGDLLDERIELVEAAADLVIYVRTNGRLRDLVAAPYPEVETPHLLIDAALEHSLSIGPLVFRGDTACLGCFVGRVTTYWGDAEPPVEPAILGSVSIIAGLIALETRKILMQRDRSLINTTVAYDFEEHKVHKNKVYKYPQCPVCSISTIDVAGAIDLPWLKQAK